MSGDLVVQGGPIFTGARIVEHLIIEEGRVVAAGRGPAPGRDRATGAARFDLEGRLVVPGFLDAHLHPTDLARRRAGVELGGTRSLAELGQRVRRWSEANPDGPVYGGGWEEHGWREHRYPALSELDRWTGDRPTVLTRVCEHLAVVNSAALEILGLHRPGPDPPGGRVDRDPAGRPTGVLRETALRALRGLPYPTLSGRPDLGRGVDRELLRAGIVAAGAMGSSVAEWEWARGRRGARDRPAPRLRVYGGADELGEVEAWGRRARTDGGLVRGIKLYADGSLGARSAWLEVPYQDAPDQEGAPGVPPAEWPRWLETIDYEGLQPSVHAIGDRALRELLAGIERSSISAVPRIEHASLVPESLLPRMRATGCPLAVQPGFRRSDVWVGDRLGPSRVASAYPFADLLRAGIRLAGSSDAPVEPVPPLDGIRCATAPGPVGQSLTVLEALRLYHAGAAEILGFPALGGLEPGRAGSFVTLNISGLEELVSAEPAEVTGTWIEGVRGFPAVD